MSEASKDETWRELVKPLFLQMQSHGVQTMRIERNGTKCHVSIELDAITSAAVENRPPPAGFTTIDHFAASAGWGANRLACLQWAAREGATVEEMEAYHRANF